MGALWVVNPNQYSTGEKKCLHTLRELLGKHSFPGVSQRHQVSTGQKSSEKKA